MEKNDVSKALEITCKRCVTKITTTTNKKIKKGKQSYTKWEFLKAPLQTGSKIKEEKFTFKKELFPLPKRPSHVQV